MSSIPDLTFISHKKCFHGSQGTGGQDSSVGTVTRYRLQGPGLYSGGVEIFFTRLDHPLGPLSLL